MSSVTLNALPSATTKPVSLPPVTKVDIEHVAVQDDPREWSRARKVSPISPYIVGLTAHSCLEALDTCHCILLSNNRDFSVEHLLA